jgi:hypothetical protein
MNSTPILAILESKDDHLLTQVIVQAQTWLSQNRDQARDVLLDEPVLRYVLLQTTKILERRYRQYEVDGAPQRGRTDYGGQAHPPGPSYRGGPQQGQFYEFQQGQPGQRQPMPAPHAQYAQYQPYPGYEQYYGGYQAAYYPGYAPVQYPGAPPGGFPQDMEEYHRMIMAMSEEDIARLPPDVRAQFESIRMNMFRQQH